jgi:hypothetical protein
MSRHSEILTYGKLLHCLDIFFRCLVSLGVGIVELVILEISCGTAILSVMCSEQGKTHLRVCRVP